MGYTAQRIARIRARLDLALYWTSTQPITDIKALPEERRRTMREVFYQVRDACQAALTGFDSDPSSLPDLSDDQAFGYAGHLMQARMFIEQMVELLWQNLERPDRPFALTAAQRNTVEGRLRVLQQTTLAELAEIQ